MTDFPGSGVPPSERIPVSSTIGEILGKCDPIAQSERNGVHGTTRSEVGSESLNSAYEINSAHFLRRSANCGKPFCVEKPVIPNLANFKAQNGQPAHTVSAEA
jgi:hypothetical protein